jgi:anti-sigma factor RsiW
MTCEEFEECLTDYLDGFLPAPLYHRWERHAALCESCTELPGQVVRSIGACYTYITEERAVPAGLHAKILQATLGTTQAEEVRAPLAARIAAWMRLWLDPIVSPQLATVATMLLAAVVVLTSTVSADGSISGLYRASVRMAEKSYQANSAVKGIASGITDFMSGQRPEVPAKMEAARPEQSREQKNR